MTGAFPVLYCAPGAGVGHLTRAAAVALALRARGVSAVIATNSPFAEGLARLCGLEIVEIPCWEEGIREYVAWLNPRLTVLDAFPWGLRGEWKNSKVPSRRLIYLARRLRLQDYLQNLGLGLDDSSPPVVRVIVAEPLEPVHEKWLTQSHAEIYRLPGRIRLAETMPAPPIPAPLAALLDTGRLWLTVHSGAETETRELIRVARADLQKNGGGELALISPRPLPDAGCPGFEYYPAARLFPRAFRIVTGAGYSSMAEAAPYPAKHLAVPLPRKYDDQAARLLNDPLPPTDGAPLAAELIASWCD